MMARKMMKTVTALGFAVGLMGARAASADSLYLSEGAFLGSAGSLSFQGFESATAGAQNPDLGAFSVAGTGDYTVVRNIGTATHHATEGSKYLFSRLSTQVTFTFDSSINSFGAMLTGLFASSPLGSEVVITTDTGAVFNTGISAATGTNIDQYFGVITDVSFSSIVFNIAPGIAGQGAGAGFDEISYGNTVITTSVVEDTTGNDGGDGGSSAHAAPTPTAGFAGLALLGALGFRRKRRIA